jgi:hypothetical protein
MFLVVDDVAAERRRLQSLRIVVGDDIEGDYSTLAQVRGPDGTCSRWRHRLPGPIRPHDGARRLGRSPEMPTLAAGTAQCNCRVVTTLSRNRGTCVLLRTILLLLVTGSEIQGGEIPGSAVRLVSQRRALLREDPANDPQRRVLPRDPADGAGRERAGQARDDACALRGLLQRPYVPLGSGSGAPAPAWRCCPRHHDIRT